MQLSKRLQAVADMVPEGSCVADIGCDHAYVSLYLIQNRIAKKVIAMDINKGPLQKARENVEKYGCCDFIELRLSDGAMKLHPKEAEVLLIAGMGGGLVQKILSDSREVVKECRALILQPQSELESVRKYISKIGFRIVEEKILLEDGKYYMMFRAEQQKPEKENYLEVEYKYGKLLLETKDSCLYEFLKKEEKKYEQILIQLEQSDMEKNKVQYEKIKEEYNCCKEGIQYYEM